MVKRVFIAISTRKESTKLDIEEIITIERKSRIIKIVTAEREVSFYDKLIYIKPLLGDNFFEVSDGLLLNLEKMKTVTEGTVLFEGGLELILSERGYTKLKKKHFSYNRMKQLEEVIKKEMQSRRQRKSYQ